MFTIRCTLSYHFILPRNNHFNIFSWFFWYLLPYTQIVYISIWHISKWPTYMFFLDFKIVLINYWFPTWRMRIFFLLLPCLPPWHMNTLFPANLSITVITILIKPMFRINIIIIHGFALSNQRIRGKGGGGGGREQKSGWGSWWLAGMSLWVGTSAVLVWASLQHRGLRLVRLFTWQLRAAEQMS